MTDDIAHSIEKSRAIIRRDKSILVMDTQALGMIAVIRSLGRAGYSVHAASSQHDALGFSSSFAKERAHHPPYESPEFITWLDLYLHRMKIRAIVPSEGFLHAIEKHYPRYSRLIPDAVSTETWKTCLSKVSTQSKLRELDPSCPHLPAGGIITADSTPYLELASLQGGPFYLKADAGQAIDGAPATVLRCDNSGELLDRI